MGLTSIIGIGIGLLIIGIVVLILKTDKET